MDYIWTLTDSTCLPEHILVDVDNLELTPSPYKVYRVDDLEPEDDDKHGITYSGWNLEITIDAREVVEHDAITKTENGHTIVIRPNVAPFRYEAWIRDNKIVAKVPLLSWSDRGNDDWMLRELYGDQDLCKPYIAGHDKFRKRLIEEYGSANYQKAFKHVQFHFMSSERPTSFQVRLSSGEIALNHGKEDKKLKLHIRSYDIEGQDIWEDDRMIRGDDGMERQRKVLCQDYEKKIRINFFAADLCIPVKRQGEDRFKADAVDDELAAALQADLSMGNRRRKTRKTS